MSNSSRFRILPTSLRGSVARGSNRTGTFQGPRWARQCDVEVAGAGWCGGIVGHDERDGTSPSRSSGAPTTAASRTPGAAASTSSTRRRDLHATAVDLIGDATFDPHEVLVVDTTDVASAEPTIRRQSVSHGRGRVGVSRYSTDVRTQLLSDLADLDTLVQGVRPRPVLGAPQSPPVGCVPTDDLATELGLPVGVEDANVEALVESPPRGTVRGER